MSARKMFELLEDRTLLSTALPTSPTGNSGSAAIVGSTLVIQGSDMADTIEVTAYFDTATIRFTNADVDESATFNKSNYDRIQIAAGAGDDTVYLDASLPSGVTVHGDAGNDKLSVGNGLVINWVAPPSTDYENTVYPAVAYGDAGDDTLFGGNGGSYFGGAGNDTVAYSSKLPDVFVYDNFAQRWLEEPSSTIPTYSVSFDNVANDGLYGHDNIHSDVEVVLGYQGAVIATSATPLPTAPTDTHTGSASIVDGTLIIQGSDDSDTISVTTQDSSTTVILSNADVDEFATFDNADFTQIQIAGGKGNDRITLDINVTANASLDGDTGNDTLTGGGGNDVLTGGDGDDTADYSMETENLTTHYPTANVISSSDRGQDTLNVETVLGGSADDTLSFEISSPGPDTIRYIDGGAGNDQLGLERVTNATIHGGDGNDNIFIAGDGIAEYYGDGGDDVLRFGRSTSTARDFHGGDGIDTVDYTSNNFPGDIKVTIDDLPGDGPVNFEFQNNLSDNVHTDVEIVLGGAGNDTIIGSAHNETLVGGDGDDSLVGNGGDDSLVGGSGNNFVVESLPTPPTPVVTASPESFFVQVSNHLLSVDGTTGNDRITIRHKVGDPSVLQVVRNGKISNFTFSDVKKIKVTAGNGNDFIDLRDIAIGATILGGNGNDSVYGSDGADSIDGGRGDDYLCGMAGNDSITGGIGHDFIRGGEGVDRLFANKTSDDLNKNKGDTIVNDVLG